MSITTGSVAEYLAFLLKKYSTVHCKYSGGGLGGGGCELALNSSYP